ncbi:MAG: peroxiredoxin family protein [Dehalococcoidia bacterium]
MLLLLSLAACFRGEKAPDFQASLFGGGEFKLSEQVRDSALVVNFWYPSCPPCREELPHFQEAWQELEGNGVRFLGVFVPQGFDTEEDARKFVAELGLTFDFATDTKAQIAQTYDLKYFPTTYFIDQGGEIFSVEISNLDTATITRIVTDMIGG